MTRVVPPAERLQYNRRQTTAGCTYIPNYEDDRVAQINAEESVADGSERCSGVWTRHVHQKVEDRVPDQNINDIPAGSERCALMAICLIPPPNSEAAHKTLRGKDGYPETIEET